MNRNQKYLFCFWFIGFCILTTPMLYIQGAFDHIDNAAVAILTEFSLLVAGFIYNYVNTNEEEIDEWFF